VPAADPDALAEAMMRVLDRPEESAARALAMREAVASQFTIDRMVQTSIEVYDRLLAPTSVQG
jgi:glycosyltransferase involved in cell wall biosynthesis